VGDEIVQASVKAGGPCNRWVVGSNPTAGDFLRKRLS